MRKRSIHLYDKDSIIEALERHGYIQSDIQRSRVAGDLLQFGLLILIAEKLDGIKEKDKVED